MSPSKVEPGDTVTITVQADPDSTVYLLVEDERNRIMGTDNDVFTSVVS